MGRYELAAHAAIVSDFLCASMSLSDLACLFCSLNIALSSAIFSLLLPVSLTQPPLSYHHVATMLAVLSFCTILQVHQPGLVIHTVGYPLDSSTYGGAWIYHMDDRWAGTPQGMSGVGRGGDAPLCSCERAHSSHPDAVIMVKTAYTTWITGGQGHDLTGATS